MFGDLYAPVTDVEDLAADDRLWLVVVKSQTTARTGFGGMNNNLVRLCYLRESGAAMTELAASLLPGLVAQAAGSCDLLPRRIKRWGQA